MKTATAGRSGGDFGEVKNPFSDAPNVVTSYLNSNQMEQ
jgi:hypothetical protein